MRQKIISNLLSSGVEKFFIIGIQFISSIILIRLLPRDEYGVIGVVMGYFVFVSILNISLESIILRDHKKLDSNLANIMSDFFVFNIYKSILFIVIAFILSFILPLLYENSDFIYAIWSITFIMIASSVTAPFTIYFASKFNQKLVTKIAIIRSLLGLILLLGLYSYPNLLYIAIKDFIISVVFILIWIYLAYKKLDFKFIIKTLNFQFLKESFFTYSLWTHLNSVVTNFIYKSDTFFLSFFLSLSVIGNYTIALNSANVANILPSILNYQNSIALSNVKGDIEKELIITNYFLLASVILGIISFIGFFLIKDFYIYLIIGSYDEFVSNILLIIVTSLIVSKIFLSPFISYLSIIHSVKDVAIKIYIPSVILASIIYLISAKYYGAYGIAYSNVIIAIMLSIITIRMALKKGYKINFKESKC